jgi:hypothetical protein
MSSTRKDARWQLAHDTIEAVGLEWDQLTSVGQTAALSKAEDLLATFPEAMIETLARRWNTPDVDPVRAVLYEILEQGLDNGLTINAILAKFDVTVKS